MTERGAARGDEDPDLWFRGHFDDAADQVLSFLGGAGLALAGQTVADIGCGDGIVDLGLALKGDPRKLVGYDLLPTDVDALRRAARATAVAEELPDCLSFATSQPDRVPAEDGIFDVVVSWSTFEHVTRPVRMLTEVKRILKPGGVLFLQLWPFFHSEHGGHLWPHYEEPFPHLLHTDAEIREQVRGHRGTDPRCDALDEYDTLNRITLGELHCALLAAGMIVARLQLLTNAVHIPAELAHVPLSLVGVGGVKLLAIGA